MRKSVYAAALAVVLPFAGSAKTVTVPADETLEFAGNGIDCTDNNSQNVVDLGAGATLKMTIGPFTTAVTLWTDVQVTNGTAYLDFEAVGAASRWFRGGVIRKGDGRLVIRNVKTLAYGMHDHLEPRPLDGAAVEFEDPDATGLCFGGDVVLLSVPSKYTFANPTERYFFLASTDQPLLGGEGGIQLSSQGFCKVFVRTAQSVAGTVTVPTGCELHLASPSTAALTVAANVVLDGGKLVSDAKGTANRMNGTVSGMGTVRLDNKLVLSQDTFGEGVSFDIGSGRILAFDSKTVDIRGEVHGIGYISLIDLFDGQTVTVGTVRGQVTAAGSGTLVPQAIEPWGIVRYRPGAQVSIDPAWISSGKVVKVADVYDGWLATDDGVVDLAKVNVAAGTQMTISLDSGNAVLKGKRETVTVEVNEGATVTLDESSDGQAISANGGRMRVLPDVSWQEKTIVWLDAAQEGAFRDYLYKGEVMTFTNGYHLIDQWHDRLRGTSSYYGFNDRHCLEAPYDGLHLYPYLVPNGLNGKDYLSFGTMRSRTAASQSAPSGASGGLEQRRMPFREADKINTEVSTVKPKFAFVVFGSQYGGGGGILSTKCTGTTEGGFLTRKTGASGGGTLSDPITEKSCMLYVDGELKDGAETYFNGGWQIFSIPVPDGNRINGLGSRRGVNDPSGDDGGQNYAEVILLNEVPSDLMRYQIEMYLATKWGLLASYKGQPVYRSACVTGAGTVDAQDSVKIGGAFRGTVETATGVSVARDDGLLPPSADEIPSEGRVTWFDPSVESTLRRNTLCKAFDATKEIYAIYDREKGNVDGARIAVGSGATSAGQHDSVDRCPHLESVAYTPVGVMNWIDFNNVYTNYFDAAHPGDDQGNTIRLVAAPGDGTSTVLATADIRMAFVIQNSVRGGGSPTLDTGVTSGTMGGGARKTSDFRDPIWRSGASDVIKNGVTYLDGRPVDGFTQGFGGRPELFAFQTEGGAYPLACFSSLYNSERVFNGEIIGETITYDRVLDETERRQVEAYLMNKWLATLPEGYTDVRRATVTGAGTYEATSAAALPAFGDGFTGTLKLEQTSFAFTVDKTGVKGDLAVVPAGTLALPAEVSVVVDWQSRPAAGLYPLVAGNALCSDTTFVCSFKGGVQPAVAEFVRNEKGVFLSVVKPGSMLIVR